MTLPFKLSYNFNVNYLVPWLSAVLCRCFTGCLGYCLFVEPLCTFAVCVVMWLSALIAAVRAGQECRAGLLKGAGLPWHCPLASLLAPSDFGEEPLAWSCVWLNHSQWLAQSCCFADSVHIFHVSRGFASFVLIELTVSDAMASKGKLDCFPSLISYTFSVAYSLIYD